MIRTLIQFDEKYFPQKTEEVRMKELMEDSEKYGGYVAEQAIEKIKKVF